MKRLNISYCLNETISIQKFSGRHTQKRVLCRTIHALFPTGNVAAGWQIRRCIDLDDVFKQKCNLNSSVVEGRECNVEFRIVNWRKMPWR